MTTPIPLQLFQHALDAADPYRAVLAALRLEGDILHVGSASYDLAACDRILVVGAGKATARMAQAIEQLLGARISAGLIVVKYGHTAALSRIEQAEAAHPLPDEAGVAATQRLLQMLGQGTERTLVICLLSGGASALLVAPQVGITLGDKQQVTELLLRAGASIDELNAVRKHLSAVKGGRLAQVAAPAQVLTLLLSDVIGDRLDVIASGPTAADSSTFADAWSVIEKYHLREAVPLRVMACLKRGMAGELDESLKQLPARVNNLVVAGNRQALSAVETAAKGLGLTVSLLSDRIQGEAREVARFLAREARAALATMQPGQQHLLLGGGETTVVVRGQGLGGRNQELALAFALDVAGETGITLLSAGTDGTDGPTDAAGAMVDGETAGLARQQGLSAERYLAEHDSYNFFLQLDARAGSRCHLKTGPTGTNVMDLQIILLQKSPS